MRNHPLALKHRGGREYKVKAGRDEPPHKQLSIIRKGFMYTAADRQTFYNTNHMTDAILAMTDIDVIKHDTDQENRLKYGDTIVLPAGFGFEQAVYQGTRRETLPTAFTFKVMYVEYHDYGLRVVDEQYTAFRAAVPNSVGNFTVPKYLMDANGTPINWRSLVVNAGV